MSEAEVEKIAKKIAFWHGQKMIHGGKTLAALKGYGSWGHSPDNYADRHWGEYRSCAEREIETIRDAQNEVVERIAAYFDTKGPGGWNQQFAEETADEIRSFKSKD